MQKIITLPHCRICVVEVAPDATNFRFGHSFPDLPKGDIFYDTKENVWNTGNIIPPPGNWSILGDWPNGITEEQAGKVVQQSIHTGLFAHYVLGIPVNTYCYKSSIESFQSLLTSHNLPTDKRMAVLWEGKPGGCIKNGSGGG